MKVRPDVRASHVRLTTPPLKANKNILAVPEFRLKAARFSACSNGILLFLNVLDIFCSLCNLEDALRRYCQLVANFCVSINVNVHWLALGQE